MVSVVAAALPRSSSRSGATAALPRTAGFTHPAWTRGRRCGGYADVHLAADPGRQRDPGVGRLRGLVGLGHRARSRSSAWCSSASASTWSRPPAWSAIVAGVVAVNLSSAH